MNDKPKVPPCPVCNKTKHVSKVGAVGDMFRCSDHGLFDNDPDEGSTVYDDPTKRIELEDERKRRAKTNQHSR